MVVSEIRVLLLLLSSVQCLCDCPLPPAGSTSCSDSKPPDNIPNIQGAAPSDGSCEFDYSFCNYIRGCRDPYANDWTSFRSHAEVQGRYAAEHSSVLQSPLLRIDHVTCFTLFGSVHNPSELFVNFGEELNNSCTVISQIAPGVADTFAKAVNIRPATGKIFFRAKSGGNPIGYVRLYSVLLTTGRCEDPICSFDAAFNDRACDFWEWNGWSVKWMILQATGVAGQVSVLDPGLPAGTLKTDLLMTTGTKSACLLFYYRVTGINDTLAVSVQHEDGGTELLWQMTNHDESSSWDYATVPIRSHNAFFIIFQGQRCHTRESKDIAIDDVSFLRSSACNYQPQGSKPPSQTMKSTLDPSCDVHKITTSAEFTERETSTTYSPASDLPTQDDSVQTGPIEEKYLVLAIVGAVLVVVGVVIAVVIWRIRKRNRSGLNNKELSHSPGVGDGEMNKMEPSRKTAAADFPSATATHCEGLYSSRIRNF